MLSIDFPINLRFSERIYVIIVTIKQDTQQYNGREI